MTTHASNSLAFEPKSTHSFERHLEDEDPAKTPQPTAPEPLGAFPGLGAGLGLAPLSMPLMPFGMMPFDMCLGGYEGGLAPALPASSASTPDLDALWSEPRRREEDEPLHVVVNDSTRDSSDSLEDSDVNPDSKTDKTRSLSSHDSDDDSRISRL